MSLCQRGGGFLPASGLSGFRALPAWLRVLPALLFFLDTGRAAVPDEPSRAEILCAFQERHYASNGTYYSFRANAAGQRPIWPKGKDYTAAEFDFIIGNDLFNFLQRYTGDTLRPLLFLTDDRIAGATAWGQVQQKIVRIPPGLSANFSMADRRRLVAETLRRQRILVTKLGFAKVERRRTASPFNNTFNPGQSAALYDAAPWVPRTNVISIDWSFNFSPTFHQTTFETDRCQFTIDARLQQWPAIPVLAMDKFQIYRTTDVVDHAALLAWLQRRGIFPGPGTGLRGYPARALDPGNLFSLCFKACQADATINPTLRNVATDTGFSFALVYPQFRYLPADDPDCCDCAPGSSQDRLRSVHIHIPLGKSGQGSAASLLFIEAPEVSVQLFHPHALRVRLAPGFTAVQQPAELWPRQVHGPGIVADVRLRPEGDGFEVLTFEKPAGRAPDATGVIDVSGLTPLGTDRFLNPQHGPGPWPVELVQLRHEKVRGAETEVYTFITELQPDLRSSLTSLTWPGGSKKESVHTSWTLDAGNVRVQEVETRLTHDAAGAPVRKEVRTFRRGANGMVLDKLVTDPDGAALTTTCAWQGDDPARLSQVIRPDGSWDQYTYDALNRVTKQRSGRLDTPTTCTDSECRVETISWPGGTGPQIRQTVVTEAGVEVSREYLEDLADGYQEVVCIVPGVTITATGNLVTRTRRVTSGLFEGWKKSVTAPDGTLTTFRYLTSPPDVPPADADTLTTITEKGAPDTAAEAVVDGTRTTVITNSRGEVIAEMLEDIVSGMVIASRTAGDFDAWGRPVEWQFQDGSTERLVYDCCGLASRTSREGLTTNFTRERPVSRVPAAGGPAAMALESTSSRTVSWTAADGSLHSGALEYIERDEGLSRRSFRRGADGSLVEISRTTSDPAGRVVASRDAAGQSTLYSESYVAQGPPPAEGQPDDRPRHLIRTETLPDGTTRIEEYAMDGSPLRITGTAVHGRRFEYGAVAGGKWKKTILLHADGTDSGEWTQSWTDMAGRPWKTLTSSGALTTHYYNAAGQFAKSVDPDGVTVLYGYDRRGRRARTGLDVDRNGRVNRGDRLTDTEWSMALRSGVWVHRTLTTVHTSPGHTRPPEFSRTETLPDGLQSWSTVAGLTTHTQRTVPAAGAWTETVTHPDGTLTVRAFSEGRLSREEKRSVSGAVLSSLTYRYDAHGRIHSVSDARGGFTAYDYDDAGRVLRSTAPDPDGPGPLTSPVTGTSYTVLGQPDVVTLPGGRTIDRDYHPTGELYLVSGTAVPATASTYDHAGRLRTLTTQPGTPAAAVTVWNYFPDSGLLQSKVHPAGSGALSYTWTPGGRPATRTNARGTVTSFIYDQPGAPSGVISGPGDLVRVRYNDGVTPDVDYTYDALGRLWTATRDHFTRSVELSLHGLPDSETWSGDGPLDGLTVNPAFDNLWRRASLTVDSSIAEPLPPSLEYVWQPETGELDSFRSGGPGLSGPAEITLGYRDGTRQVESRTVSETGHVRMIEQRTFDGLHRLSSITSVSAGTSAASSQYRFDAEGRRTENLGSDGTWWHYTYDDHSQVRRAERRLLTGAAPEPADPALPGQTFSYDYDGAGNRTAASQGGGGVNDTADTACSANAANQFTAIGSDRSATAIGIADPAAILSVNGSPAARAGPWWASNSTAPAGGSAALIDFNINATLDGETASATATVLVPPASVAPQYDADGNLTDDGLRIFNWDADNRLRSITTKDGILPPGAPQYRVRFVYDDLSRRIIRTVESRTGDGAPWIAAQRRAFLYDGWQSLAEFDYTLTETGSVRELVRSYAWDNGAIEPRSPTLLLVRRHTGTAVGTHAAASDGNNNVIALTDITDGTESARYDYDPFGNLLRATGPFSAENPHRFSSQYTDDITGLIYYGYRHYDPVSGRWLSRDPIGESAGANLYTFLGNDGVNNIDLLGMDSALALVVAKPDGSNLPDIFFANGQGWRVVPSADGSTPGTLAPATWVEGMILTTNYDNGPAPMQGLNPLERGWIGAVKGAQAVGGLATSAYQSLWEAGDSAGMHARSWLDGDWQYTASRLRNAKFWTQYYATVFAKLIDDPCFRSRVWDHLSPKLKQQFGTADGLSQTAAQLAATAGLAAAGISANAKYTGLLKEFDDLLRVGDSMPGTAGRAPPLTRLTDELAEVATSHPEQLEFGFAGNLENPKFVLFKGSEFSPSLLREGEYTLNLPRLGSEALQWTQNKQALQRAISMGGRIRELHPDAKYGFLDREREILQSAGWQQNY